MFEELGHTFSSMFSNIILAIPNVILALFYLLIAWIVASIAKGLFTKVLTKFGVGRAIAKTPLVEDEAAGDNFLSSIGKLIYVLVFILFLPAVFNAVNMNDVAAPISNMMTDIITFIPNLLVAAILIILGVFVAKLVKELFERFFQTLNLDKWFKKINPDSNVAESQTTLSSVLATIIYVLVIIPFITMGLDALKVSAISEPVKKVLDDVVGIIPGLFLALILIVVGYYIGKLLSNLLTNLLDTVGFGKIFESLGFSSQDQPSKFNISKFIGTVVHVVIVLFFAVQALHVLNLDVLNMIGEAIIVYIPYVVSALIILGVGLFIANLVGNWVQNSTHSKASAVIIKSVIIVFAVFMTLNQLHFATSIVNTAFLLILGGLMVAFAIAFGIGGRDFAKKQLERVDKAIDKKSDDQ